MFLKHLAVSNYLLDTGLDRAWTPPGRFARSSGCPGCVHPGVQLFFGHVKQLILLENCGQMHPVSTSSPPSL